MTWTLNLKRYVVNRVLYDVFPAGRENSSRAKKEGQVNDVDS
jgi:hypothetical protein